MEKVDYGSHRCDSLVCTKYSYITVGVLFVLHGTVFLTFC